MSQVNYSRCRIGFTASWSWAEEENLKNGRTYLIRLRGSNLSEGRLADKAIYERSSASFWIGGFRLRPYHYDVLIVRTIFNKEGPPLED
jgi:hypothetical protein